MENRKVALITGGATGIGKEVALMLAAKGIDIVINYSRSEKDANDTCAAIQAAGVSCLLEKADVANDKQVRAMVKNAVSHFGRLDYLVNGAGMTDFVDMADLEGLLEEHWDRAMAVNVKGLFFVSRAAAPHLKKSGGSIVNISSLAGYNGRGSSIAYAAAKAAAISVTKSLAVVLAPDVRVNSVAPGPVMSRWMAGREENVQKFAATTPLGKICKPENVAEVIVPLLLSAALVTGQTVLIEGGSRMQ
ncbi:MAG: SDR family oxidoreductase [Negativicutes bacterium]|nr:SDR family oxidoreductase [Negativicutes bacterium]